MLLGARTEGASASGFGGIAASVGLLSALSALVLLKAWQAHLHVGGLTTLGGLLALAAGVVLLWRLPTRQPRRAFASGSSRTGPATVDRSHLAAQIPLPPELDSQCLMSELRQTFHALQNAWDHGSRDELGRMTTVDMLEELDAARSAGCGATNRSEVVRLDIHLVAFEELDATQLVCVEYSGLIRESASARAEPFRELWMLSRVKEASADWRLARHQALF